MLGFKHLLKTLRNVSALEQSRPVDELHSSPFRELNRIAGKRRSRHYPAVGATVVVDRSENLLDGLVADRVVIHSPDTHVNDEISALVATCLSCGSLCKPRFVKQAAKPLLKLVASQAANVV